MNAQSTSIRMNLFSRLQRFCIQIVNLFIFMILAFSIVACDVCIVVFCIKHQDVFSVVEILWSFPALILLLLTILLSRIMQNQKEATVSICMPLISACIASIMILSYDTQPCSDYGQIWQCANEMAQGTFTGGVTPRHYMYYYNWQLGITAFESLLIQLGLSFTGLKIFNSILMLITQHAVYHLVKRKFSFRTACIAYALATLHLPWILSIPQFTNHHIAIVFLLLGLYFIEQHTLVSWVCAGISLAVMNLLRPIGIIVLLAAICYSIYRIAHMRNFRPAWLLLALMLSYSLFIAIFDHAFISIG